MKEKKLKIISVIICIVSPLPPNTHTHTQSRAFYSTNTLVHTGNLSLGLKDCFVLVCNMFHFLSVILTGHTVVYKKKRRRSKVSLLVSSPRWIPLWLNCCWKLAMGVPPGVYLSCVCSHFPFKFRL